MLYGPVVNEHHYRASHCFNAQCKQFKYKIDLMALWFSLVFGPDNCLSMLIYRRQTSAVDIVFLDALHHTEGIV
jgi:hypothetical protein